PVLVFPRLLEDDRGDGDEEALTRKAGLGAPSFEAGTLFASEHPDAPPSPGCSRPRRSAMKVARKPLLALTAADLMSAPVVTIPQEMSLAEAAQVLAREQISGAP